MPETLFQILTHLASAIAGGLVVLLFTHRLTISRERQRDSNIRQQTADDRRADRKRGFRAWIVKWRTEIETQYATNTFRTVYDEKRPELRRQTSEICDDFGTRKADFERLIGVASGFRIAQMANEKTPDKEQILKALDDIVKFLDAL
jgi:hypothetical protein